MNTAVETEQAIDRLGRALDALLNDCRDMQHNPDDQTVTLTTSHRAVCLAIAAASRFCPTANQSCANGWASATPATRTVTERIT